MDIYVLLIIGHLVGTILGVGGATLIEVQINEALSDGKMSLDEKMMMSTVYTVVRIGLVLTIFTGFGFLLLYNLEGNTAALYNPNLWVKLIVISAIAINALLLQARVVSLYWGSAVSFVSWWAAATIGILSSNGVSYPFFATLLVYVAAVGVGAVVLHWFRMRITK